MVPTHFVIASPLFYQKRACVIKIYETNKFNQKWNSRKWNLRSLGVSKKERCDVNWLGKKKTESGRYRKVRSVTRD